MPGIARILVATLLAALLSTGTRAQMQVKPKLTAITGGTVHVGNGDVLENAVVLIKAGKIEAVGAALEVPEGATVVDASGKHIYPGLIDADSQLLLAPGSLEDGKALATSNVLDAVDLHQPRVLEDALSQGVTCVYLSSRNRGLVDGKSAILKLIPGKDSEDLVVRRDVALTVDLSTDGTRPTARLNNLSGLESSLKETQDYIEAFEVYAEELEEYAKKLEELRKKEDDADEEPGKSEQGEEKKPADKRKEGSDEDKPDAPKPPETPNPDEPKPDEPAPEPKPEEEGAGRANLENSTETFFLNLARRSGRASAEGEKPAAGGDAKKDEKDQEEEHPKKPKKPAVDLRKEVLKQVLEGKVPVRARAHYAADILNLLELQDRFRFHLVLSGCGEAHHVTSALKKSGVAIVRGQGIAEHDDEVGAAARLKEAGVAFALSSHHGRETRFLSLGAGVAVAGGLDERAALSAMTLDAARILGIADRVGSLATGKDADVVIASGAPTATSSRVEMVMVNGKVVFER